MGRREVSFIDKVKIRVRSGKGGDGCVSFRREPYTPKGGPDGGDGGDGGDVICKGNRQIVTLLDYKYHPFKRAGDGRQGMGRNRHGKNGKRCIFEIPFGTVIKDAQTGELLHDVMDDTPLVLLKGGQGGGRGNAQFVNSVRQAPRIFEKGKPASEKELLLELKLIAGVGLVGYPNAGKSSLLRVLSNARPKVAAYPFTTLVPHLGVIRGVDTAEVVIADIPGIIEGAHKNVGLGHAFLRHIERTKLLIFVIDIAGTDGRDPVNDYCILRDELAKHDSALLKERSIIVANKIDLMGDVEVATLAKDFKLAKSRIFPVSAVTREGIDTLKKGIVREYVRLCKISS